MKPLKKSARKQSRYQRDDVIAVLKHWGFFGDRIHPTKIADISPEGIAVYTNQRFKSNARIQIVLGFSDGQRFTIKGRIAHKLSSEENDASNVTMEMLIGSSLKLVNLPFKYGIKFEDIPPLYIDYLIESGLQIKLDSLSTDLQWL